MGQSKGDPCVFRYVVGEEATTIIVYVHVDDIAVATKDKLVFDAFHAQLAEEIPVNDVGGLSWRLRCAFERGKAKGVVKMAQTAYVDLLVKCFDIQYGLQAPASVEFDLGPKRSNEIERDLPHKWAGGGL